MIEVVEPVERKVYSNIVCRARHTSSEGCQLVVEPGTLSAGQRCALVLEALDRVSGTVRWVVDNRAGFAFDERMDRERQKAIAARCAGAQGIELTIL